MRLSDSSPEELPELHQPAAHRTLQPASSHKHSMADTENVQENVNGTAAKPEADVTPDNTSESASEAKKGPPPVAPKPAWFRQSLRKIRDEQHQKTTEKPNIGFSRSFGVRPASSGLSIKQKINSFENFSSHEGSDKVGSRRPVVPSTSLPLEEKESRSYSSSHRDNEKAVDETTKAVKENQPASLRETEDVTPSAAPASPPSSPSEGATADVQPSGTDPESGKQSPCSDQVHSDEQDVVPESEGGDLSRSEEPVVQPAPTSDGRHPDGETGPTEETQEDGALSGAEAAGTAPPAADSEPVTGLEDECLEKILALSNQVTITLLTASPFL